MTQPESKPSARPARRRTARILIGSGIAVVLVLAGSGVVYAATQNHADSYRTAVAKTGSIDSTMALSGSIAAASRRDVAFPVSGTVADVAVSLGDTVTAGQKLATLDPTTLQAAVDTANQTVSDAEQKVQDDLDSQTATTTTASTGSASGFGDGQSNGGQNSGGRQSGGQDNAGQQSGGDQGGSQGNGQGGDGGGATPPTTTATPTPSPTATPEPDDAVQTAIDEVTAAQTALLAQYDTSAAALTTSTQAVGDSKSTCQPFLDAVSSGADSDDAAAAAAASASLDSLGGADAPAADSGDAGADASAPTDAELQQMLTDCQTAIDAALTAQTDTGTQQSALKDAADALDTAVKDLQTALADSASSSTTADTSSFTTGGMTVTAALATTALSATATTATATAAADATGGAYSGTTTTAATAAQIVADEAAITAAQAQVAIAKQQLTLATLTSPIAGTVMQVALAAGDEVSADSTTAVITVVADSGYVVSTTVDLARIGSLAVGQKATVTLPSDGSSHDGSVSSIGILDVSETSTPSYTVDISIAAGDTILIGASAEIVVSLASVDKVLTVPSSAVHVSGASTTVDRLVDGKSVATKMTIGAAGSETIEVTDGLSAGDVVILADLDQPMDSDSTDSSTGLTGLGGNGNGTGGGGAGGAGLTGGPGGGFGGQGGFTGGGPGGN